MSKDGNPYLKPGRLADVIAAITATGLYKFYKLPFEGWSMRIGGSKADAARWETVFREHPEFFRINSDDNKASLVWRRQFSRTFYVDDPSSKAGAKELYDPPDDRLSRKPLDAGEVSALVSVAVDLHDRALEQDKAGRWWIPVATGVLAFVGSLSGAWIRSLN